MSFEKCVIFLHRLVAMVIDQIQIHVYNKYNII